LLFNEQPDFKWDIETFFFQSKKMLVSLLIVFVALFAGRFIYLLAKSLTRPNDWQSAKVKRSNPARTMIILGSGGHTTEMLEIVQCLNIMNYEPRVYVLVEQDSNSCLKTIDVESRKGQELGDASRQNYSFVTIPRSRRVKQSYITSVFTTLYSIVCCIPVLFRHQPDLILANGPGVCVPICFLAFLSKVLLINRGCRIVFVESFCRVKTLSLSGKILYWFTDLFVVQWPDLKAQDQTTLEHFGRLC
jgi:beta-1,4-N-acetylglucosaminyltransferase